MNNTAITFSTYFYYLTPSAKAERSKGRMKRERENNEYLGRGVDDPETQ